MNFIVDGNCLNLELLICSFLVIRNGKWTFNCRIVSQSLRCHRNAFHSLNAFLQSNPPTDYALNTSFMYEKRTSDWLHICTRFILSMECCQFIILMKYLELETTIFCCCCLFLQKLNSQIYYSRMFEKNLMIFSKIVCLWQKYRWTPLIRNPIVKYQRSLKKKKKIHRIKIPHR